MPSLTQVYTTEAFGDCCNEISINWIPFQMSNKPCQQQPFTTLFSRTSWVGWYRKRSPFLAHTGSSEKTFKNLKFGLLKFLGFEKPKKLEPTSTNKFVRSRSNLTQFIKPTPIDVRRVVFAKLRVRTNAATTERRKVHWSLVDQKLNKKPVRGRHVCHKVALSTI